MFSSAHARNPRPGLARVCESLYEVRALFEAGEL